MKVKAIYNFENTHNDELSIAQGDIITVTQSIEGGWWEGTLNGQTGWFPSNYVTPLTEEETNSQHSASYNASGFQKEIMQHILEDEIKFCNCLADILYNFVGSLETMAQIPFHEKVHNLKTLLQQLSSTHRVLMTSLHDLAHQSTDPASSEPQQRIGHLFLSLASQLRELHILYAQQHLPFVFAVEQYASFISTGSVPSSGPASSTGCSLAGWEVSRLKQHLSQPLQQIHKYAILLQDLQRYMPDSHPDRGDVQRAAAFFQDLDENLMQVQKMKERDVDMLMAKILGWPSGDTKPLSHLGDPLLTTKVTVQLTPPNATSPTTVTNSVFVLFRSALVFLACTPQPDVYHFLNCLPTKGICFRKTYPEAVEFVVEEKVVSAGVSGKKSPIVHSSVAYFVDDATASTVCEQLLRMEDAVQLPAASPGPSPQVHQQSHGGETQMMAHMEAPSVPPAPHLQHRPLPSAVASGVNEEASGPQETQPHPHAHLLRHPPVAVETKAVPPQDPFGGVFLSTLPLTEPMYSLRPDPPLTVFMGLGGEEEAAMRAGLLGGSLLMPGGAEAGSHATGQVPGSKGSSTAHRPGAAAHRKKSERQKSAINPEDIEKSILRMDVANRRMESDTGILKLVEWYYQTYATRQTSVALDLSKLRDTAPQPSMSVQSHHGQVMSKAPPSYTMSQALTTSIPISMADPQTHNNFTQQQQRHVMMMQTAPAAAAVNPPPVMLPTRGKRP